MNTWQIGSALGVNNATVSRDMKSGGKNLPPERTVQRDMKSSDRFRSDEPRRDMASGPNGPDEPRRERLAQVH